jgi:hypothetical protein
LDEGLADGNFAGDFDADLDVEGTSADFDGVSSAFLKNLSRES